MYMFWTMTFLQWFLSCLECTQHCDNKRNYDNYFKKKNKKMHRGSFLSFHFDIIRFSKMMKPKPLMSLIAKGTHIWNIVACPGLNLLDTKTFTGANRNRWVHHEQRFDFNVNFVFWTFWKCVQTIFLLQERRSCEVFENPPERKRHKTSF